MIDPGSDSWNYVAAMFSYEFLGGGVEYDTIERIHRGEVDEWVHALLNSGMFESATVAAIATLDNSRTRNASFGSPVVCWRLLHERRHESLAHQNKRAVVRCSRPHI